MINSLGRKVVMTNDWIIDVLMDLKKFSANNKLENLAEQLDDTIMVATSDLSLPDMSLRRMVGDFANVRQGVSAMLGSRKHLKLNLVAL